MDEEVIRTDRLILRQWQESDLEPFAKLNADPRVMEYFPSVLTIEESNRSVEVMSEHIRKWGWGFFAVTLIRTNEFIGLIGLDDVHLKAHFTPAVQIGWRIAYEHWGRGYATEGAKAVLEYGFEIIKLNEIVSFTAVKNQKSQEVMKKIGMKHYPEQDFEHPRLPEGHRIRRLALYRITRDEWKSSI